MLVSNTLVKVSGFWWHLCCRIFWECGLKMSGKSSWLLLNAIKRLCHSCSSSLRFPHRASTFLVILTRCSSFRACFVLIWWAPPSKHIVDQGNQVCLECRFRKWCEEAPGMAVYDAEELDHAAWVNYPAGQVYVREVPPPLMVTCSLESHRKRWLWGRLHDNGRRAALTHPWGFEPFLQHGTACGWRCLCRCSPRASAEPQPRSMRFAGRADRAAGHPHRPRFLLGQVDEAAGCSRVTWSTACAIWWYTEKKQLCARACFVLLLFQQCSFAHECKAWATVHVCAPRETLQCPLRSFVILGSFGAASPKEDPEVASMWLVLARSLEMSHVAFVSMLPILKDGLGTKTYT